MYWNKLNKLKVIGILVLIFSIFVASGPAFAQTADEYFFEQGKEALEHLDLWGAHYWFEEALYINPDHQGANLFYALTRILMISKSTNFNNLLTRAGVSTYGRDIFNWTADFKRDPEGDILLPSGSPTGKEWQDFLKKDVLPQVDGALDNLSNVKSSYETTFRWIVENGLGVVNSPNILIDITKSWAPNEWAGYKLMIDGAEYTIASNTENMIYVNPNWTISSGTHIYEIFENVEIDYGDVLVLKGSLYMAKAVILALASYDVNIDIDAIVSLANSDKLDIQNNIINTYKNFLNLLPTEQLSEAKSALREAINIFTQAVNSITAETDPQEDDLLVIETPEEAQEYLDLLADLNNALDGTTLIRKIGLDLNLGEFFDYPKNLRGYLPIFVGSSHIKRGTFPDPTFGGILPGYLDQDGITHRDMTREELEKRLEDHVRDSYPISPLVLYDNFSAPKIDTNRWRQGELVREIIRTGDYVYDDFSAPNIDKNKWNQWEFVREIKGGKLLSKISAHGSRVTNNLNFQKPDLITYIEADVTIGKIEGDYDPVDPNKYSFPCARLTGFFYNDGTAGGQGSFMGEVQAAIRIRLYGGAISAEWAVWKSLDDAGTTWQTLSWDVFPDAISLNIPYKISIAYEPSLKKFTFKIGGSTRTWISTDTIQIPSNRPWKAIGTDVWFSSSASNLSGKISALFDNVIAKDESGNILVDEDFSSSNISSDNWRSYEFVREILGGKLRSKVRSDEAYSLPVTSSLEFPFPSTINSFQAKVTPLIYQNPQGLYEMAGIWAGAYNDGSGTGTPGDRTGDVFGLVRLGGTGVKPTAEWEVIKITNAAGTDFERIASGPFSTAVSLGTTYTLFVGWDGTKFTFKVNNLVLNYMPTPPINPIKVPSKGLGTWIAPEEDKKEGTIEALFDDVTIIVGTDYKLLSKLASPNPSMATTFPYTIWNDLTFSNPNFVNSIQADVAIVENSIIGKGDTRARLGGTWYNDGTPGGGMTGDVWAEISLRRDSTGFYCSWGIAKSTNPAGTTWVVLAGGRFNTPIGIGITCPLYIGYDSGVNQFTLRIGNEVKTFGPTGLPARIRDANSPLKALTTRVQIDNPASTGYISATFDNVYKNGVLYDDFSAQILDSAKWTTYENVREISGGKFRSKVRSSSASIPPSVISVQSRLEFLYPSEINAIQTKVTPLVFQNEQGASPRARIAGTFYNDGTRGPDPKDRTGDVGAQVRIGGSGFDPVAEWVVWRMTDFAGIVPEVLAYGRFNTPISLEKTYTLFLGWDGIKFTFKIDNEVRYYEPETGVYLTNNPWRSIETQVYDPQGREATIEALFDDVMVSGPLLSASPGSYDFGKVIVRTSAKQAFTITNNGSTSVSIKSIDLMGGDASMFYLDSVTYPNLSARIPPKGKCNVVVSFWPTSKDAKSTALRVVIDAPRNPAIFVPLKGTGVLETISTPSTPDSIPSGLTSGTTGTTYTFKTGGSSSSLDPTHRIQYLFDWGDGTNSGWLPVGTTSAKKIWTSSGIYNVKAMARCATHTAVVSDWSPERTVDITYPIHPTSPPIGSQYNVSTLHYPQCGEQIPTFTWSADEFFKGYEVQFSSDYRFKVIPVKVKTLTTSATIPAAVWKTILLIPGKSGGVVYWKVVGTRSDATIATSETSLIIVGPPQPVSDAWLSHTSKTPPPTLTWKNNSNIKFKVWFGNDPDFSKPGVKKTALDFSVTNPCDNGGIFTKTLTSSQWIAVRGVVGDVSGPPIFWYVESWDVLGRSAKTDVMSFVLEP